MTTCTATLLLALVAAAAAAPFGGGTPPPCSTECPVAAAKLSFIPGKTYSYTYTGKSKVQLKGVDGGLVETQWEKEVFLTFITPCDMAISFKGSKVDGQTGPPGADKLERYPLVVAMTDGRVQRVCSHPDDDTWAINMKKGVASALQNSLPSLSITNSGLNFTETDVAGTCPTYHEVEAEGTKVLVKKEKNHRLCQEHYQTPDEIRLPYLMGPLPIQESTSICRQEIDNGIISSVVCEDKKVVRPSYGAYKFVEAIQESTLRLTSSDASQPDTIPLIVQTQLVPRSLRYDYETPKKEPSLVPQLEQTLQYICQITKDGVAADAAVQMRKAIHLMRRIPEQGFKDIYAKVHSKQICPEHDKLRSLYMGAIASVHEPESVQVMVTELVEGRANGTLPALYSVAFYLVPRPNRRAIQALEPLFKAREAHLISAQLAASSMVNKYCRHNPQCYDDPSVRSLPQAIKEKVEEDLSGSSSEESQKQALSALKSLGNMGVMTPEAAQVVLRYMQNQNKKVNIRVAAAQAFRLAKCERSVTRQLVQYSLQSDQNTEVRIASYLAAIPCANYEDLQTIVTRISFEENTQVRGFILSHLLNLQQSDSPEKQRLRYLMTNIVIPQDFEADLRKYSRNLDLSYFSPSLGLGAEVESNLIYAPGSFIPRSLDLNLTTALDGTGNPINIGEIGARLEGLEPIIAQLFGPASYFKTSSYSKMFHDLISFIQKNWNTIKQELESSIRQRRSIDYAALESIINKLYGSQSGPVQADVFARFLGQEINYASLSKRLQDINTDSLVETFIQYLMQTLINMKNMNLDSAWAAQLGMDYSFPTIQGTPLKMTMETTTVAGIKMQTNLDGIFSGPSATGSNLKILPSLSVETHCFIGYDAYITKSGLKMNTTVSSTNGVAIKVTGQSGQELQVDVELPDKMEIIHVQSETYLMKHNKDQPENKILPPSIQDTRIRCNSCFTAFESVFGLKMCYNIDVPDIFQANSLPLGSPALATLSINKTESSIKGYKIAVTTSTESQAKKYGWKVSVMGSSSPKEADVEMKLKKESESYHAEIKLQSSSTRGEAKASIINRPEYKSFQTDVSFTGNAYEFSKAIKIDLKTSSAGDGKKYEMNIFSSPFGRISQESIIFRSKVVQSYRAPWVVVDISAKTENNLQRYIPINLEVNGDLKYYSGIPIPMRLRKFELETGMYGWKVTSFIRKAEESGQSGDYSAAFYVAQEGQELIHFLGDLRLQGMSADDFKEQLFVKAKVGQAEYKMQQMIEYHETRMAVNLQLTRASDNMKLIEIVAEKDTQEIKFFFQVQEAEYMTPIKVAARAVRQGQDYSVESVVMRGHQTLLQVHGPVTYINSQSLTKLGTDIKINNVYQFVSSLEFEGGKQAVFLEIKKQEEMLVSLECNLKTLPSQGPSLQAKINLPILFEAQTDVSITNNVIHASTNTLLLPRSSSPRRIKAFLDINWDNKQGQVMVLWNADRDPSKKIAIDTIIVPESGRPAGATMHVKITILEKTYHANVKVVAPYLWQQYRERNSINLEVQTPDQQRWMLEVGVQNQGGNRASVDYTFRSVDNSNYHLTSDLRWQPLDEPFCFQAEAGITYVSPQNRHSQFSLQVVHHSHPQQHTIHFTMEASTPNIQAPLKINFSVDNQDYSYITNLQGGVSSPETMFKWQLETYTEGGVKSLDIAFDLKAIRDVLKTLNKMVSSRGDTLTVTSAFENERSAYRWLYSRSSLNTHSFKMESPSRTLEAEATYSPSKAGIKIYPNRTASEAKYEVTGEYIKGQWGGNPKYQVRMSHPLLARDMTAEVEYVSSGSSQQGTFQLDVFPDTADKITGSLTSYLRANNTVVIEANLSTRVLQVKPRVTVAASWAPHTAAFNFTFQETPSSPESFTVYAKYDRISRSYAAVTFQMATAGRRTVDVSGVVEPRWGPHCNGFALLTNARTSVLGNFIVNSTMCRPAFLEVALAKHSGNRVYKTQIGLQSPYKAEVSISETDRFQIRNRYLSLLGIELASPRRVKIDWEYKPEEMIAIQEFVREEAYRAMEAALSWTDAVYREVEQQAQKAGVPFPAPEIRRLVQEVVNDITNIYAELIYNDLWSEWDAIMQIWRGPTVTFIRAFVYQSMMNMANMQRQLAVYSLQQIHDLEQLFRPAINEILKAVIQVSEWMQTGEEPEVVRRLVEEWQRTAIYQLLQTHIIEPIKESYPRQYQATMDVAAKVIDTFRQDLVMLQQRVWASPTLRTIILKAIDMSQEETQTRTLEWWTSQVTQRILFVAPEPGMYRFGIQIPLYRPIYSLTQVVNLIQSQPSFTQKMLLSAENLSPIPVSKIMEYYYTWMPANLSSTIPPFNRSALVVGDTEILTFDGALLRAPVSSCKVLLASVPDVASVYMAHQQPSEGPEITFQAGSTKAIIKPNMEVDVNGRPVQGRETFGDLVIEVNSHYVTIVSPIMGVHRMKEERMVMVNVSGWAYNHTRGFLGSYDNERGNDRMMPNGRNASSLHELVSSWQVNPSCATPPISPINPTQIPVKKNVICDIIFFQMMPCTPVVSPRPFIQRCYVDPRPFEVARSYQSFCRMHGVKFPMSLI